MPLSDQERECLERVRTEFDVWWDADGQFLDPDPRDVAIMAFLAGVASVGSTQH